MFYLRQTAHVDAGPALEAAGLVHRIRQPMVAGPHPTIVMLHGLGGSEDSTWLLGPALPREWLVATPRGIEDGPDGGYAWRARERDEWPELHDFEPAVEAIARFTRSLRELYGADPDRTYFMGFSQGAATSFATAMAHRGLAQGVASVVGFVPAACDSASLAELHGLPVFMAAGLRDPLIPLDRSRDCADALRESGTRLEYHEYDVGHKLSSQGTADLRQWWTRQLP